MEDLNRRAALGLGIAAAATPLLTLGSNHAAAQEATTTPYAGKIIDFRFRPPIIPYRTNFDIHISRQKAKNKMYSAPENAIAPSMYKVGEEEGIDLSIQEMDRAGITYVVTPGRQVSGVSLAAAGDGPIDFSVSDALLVELRKRYNDRLFGLTALDLNKPVDELVAQIKKAITVHGLWGVVMEPGYYTDETGGTLWADNPKLFPIYETIIELDTFLMHQSGIYAGPDIGVNYWPPVDRLLQRFPDLKLFLDHGGYPDIFGALALAVKHQNFYISPDIYCFFPGGESYVNSIYKLQDQMVWASAYPMAALEESVVGTLEYAAAASLSPEVMQKYMYGNAAKLLKITS